MSTGAIGGGVQMATGLLGSFINAKGAVHGAETEAAAGQASIGTEQNATTAAIQADAYATAPERNIGTMALYELASMLGIDPALAFGAPAGSSGGSGGSSGGPTNGSYTSTNMYGTQPNFEDLGSLSLDSIHGDPLGVFKDYKFNPAQFGSPQFYMGGQPSAQGYGPGTPGFGSLMKPFSMADFFNNVDPSYGFRLQQGMQGIENSAAARGMQLSGSNLKDLDVFSQGLASEEFQNAFNRFQTQQQNEFSRLAQLAGAGATASENLGATAANLLSGAGTNIANTQQGIGNALAAGQVGAANAIASGITQSGKDVNSMMGGSSGGSSTGGSVLGSLGGSNVAVGSSASTNSTNNTFG